MPPVTPAHWNGVKSAHSPGPVCPQNLPNISNTTEALKTMTTGRLRTLKRLIPLLLNQSEDCLYLNIFTPYPCKLILCYHLFNSLNQFEDQDNSLPSNPYHLTLESNECRSTFHRPNLNLFE